MSNVRYTNRDGVVGFEQKHSTVVFGTKLRIVGKSAPHTFQNPFIVDVCVVSHHVGPSIVIIHLAVYEVMSGFDDCNEASVVVNIAQLITYNPVGYKNTCCVKNNHSKFWHNDVISLLCLPSLFPLFSLFPYSASL